MQRGPGTGKKADGMGSRSRMIQPCLREICRPSPAPWSRAYPARRKDRMENWILARVSHCKSGDTGGSTTSPFQPSRVAIGVRERDIRCIRVRVKMAVASPRGYRMQVWSNRREGDASPSSTAIPFVRSDNRLQPGSIRY